MHMTRASMVAVIANVRAGPSNFSGVARAAIAIIAFGSITISLVHFNRYRDLALRPRPARRDVIAKRAHDALDLVLCCRVVSQCKLKPLRHDCDVDGADTGQTRHRSLDLGCTGRAIHARDRPLADCSTARCRISRHYDRPHPSAPNRDSFLRWLESLVPPATRASRGISVLTVRRTAEGDNRCGRPPPRTDGRHAECERGAEDLQPIVSGR